MAEIKLIPGNKNQIPVSEKDHYKNPWILSAGTPFKRPSHL